MLNQKEISVLLYREEQNTYGRIKCNTKVVWSVERLIMYKRESCFGTFLFGRKVKQSITRLLNS